MFGKRFLNYIFCIDNAYVCACYLLCPLPGSSLIAWWLPWQRFIETFTEVSNLNTCFMSSEMVCISCMNPCTASYTKKRINFPQCNVIHRTFYTDEMLNECIMDVCTILLTLESCSSMKRCGIRSLHTVKYSTLHATEMYLIVFMLNKPLSETEYESSLRCHTSLLCNIYTAL